MHQSIGKKDKLFLSFYSGGDQYSDHSFGGYNLVNPTTNSSYGYGFEQHYQYDWGNAVTSLRWNHLYGDRLFSNLTLIYSQFKYKSELDDYQAFDFENFPVFASEYYSSFRSNITDISVKVDYDYFLEDHHLQFGAGITRHKLVHLS